jgi:hypothetical protein
VVGVTLLTGWVVDAAVVLVEVVGAVVGTPVALRLRGDASRPPLLWPLE